ncbi:hypothetical protein [Alloprevotella tannerae]|uniref:hypothetical protein n=1 Tax=Alloprevotella tannerae TaxID=76122 RepID=UPI00288A28C7|nr:hypothetical protein [Alloprevotella tannerae]
MLPPNDGLLPPNDGLLPPYDRLLPPNEIDVKPENEKAPLSSATTASCEPAARSLKLPRLAEGKVREK